MIEKAIAEHICKVAEDELLKCGHSSVHTITLMKTAVEEIGKDYSDYFYPDNGKMIFNLKRWKRHFLNEKESLT